MKLSIKQTSDDYLQPQYNFIVLNSETESNVKIFDTGVWLDWGKFCKQAESYYSQIEKESEEDYENSDKKLAYDLLELSRSKPHFVERSEKIKKRREKGPVVQLISKIYDDYLHNLFVWAVFGFILYLIGLGLWYMAVAPLLDRWGFIEYETKGDQRYAKFLTTVADCQLKDELRSPEKTDKWPRYAVYRCPDGSRKTWRYKIKVITESKGKLIVE
jgi:hypothetical protein